MVMNTGTLLLRTNGQEEVKSAQYIVTDQI